MKKLVIFDLDGTLLNTIEDINDALNNALYDHNLRKLSQEECKYVVGSGVKVIIDKTLKIVLGDRYKNEKDDYLMPLLLKYQEYYEKCQRNKTKPYDGIVELLQKLKDKGIKLAILSNKPHNDTINIIDYYFKGMFDYVLGQTKENRIKPAIDGIIQIERDLNITNNKEILYVGDTEIDIETAKNAKLMMVACSWGFRKVSELTSSSLIAYSTNDIYGVAIR